MNPRGWVGWFESNPIAGAILAFVLGIGLASGGFLAAEVGVRQTPAPSIDSAGGEGQLGAGFVDDGGTEGGSDGATDTTGSVALGDTTTGTTQTGGTTAGQTRTPAGGSTGASTTGGTSTGGATGGGTTSGGSTTGGTTSGGATTGGATSGGSTTGGATSGGSSGGAPAGACRPEPGYTATGIDEESVTIGIIVSDVSFLPAQLRPVYEGLLAWANAVNARGGVCGRQVKIEYRNDNSNPQQLQSQYRELVPIVFAFVGMTSLVDQNVYQDTKPFDPIASDNGQFVPDIGGQAYSYNHSQSAWHGSPVGSLSPVLTGGTAFIGMHDDLKSEGRACEKVGILYLNDPNGASQDQGQLGKAAVESSWGLSLPAEMFEQQLAASVPQYELTVRQMLDAGVDCAFTYADLQSNINFVQAAANNNAWPADACPVPTRCFDMIYGPYTVYDTKFVNDLGDNARGVRSYIPHLPLDETNDPAMAAYVRDLQAADPNFRPSTYSVIGYASGLMFEEAMLACGPAPTRNCAMDHVRRLRDWSGGGLMAPISPFRATQAELGTYRSIDWGTWNFKWIFNCEVRVQVVNVGGGLDWRRDGPSSGYECGPLHIARGPDQEP